MAKRPPVNPSDIEETVDKITSQFYSEVETNDEPHPMDRYLHFSDRHQQTNHVMIGVGLFFFLILGVWGFLWYQSVQSIEFVTPSIDTSIITDGTDDFAAIFDELKTLDTTQAAQEKEAVLKSDLSAALAKQIEATAVLGTSTESVTNTTEL